MGATEEYVDRVVEIVSSAVPRLQVSVHPALEVEDVSMIEFEHPEIPSMELMVATDAAFVKVLISRYVFDAVPLDDLATSPNAFRVPNKVDLWSSVWCGC